MLHKERSEKTFKQQLLENPENSVLSYFGAALLGAVLSFVFHLSASGQILTAVGIYIFYMIIITVIDTYATNGVKFACEFNEFWISLEALIKRKMAR